MSKEKEEEEKNALEEALMKEKNEPQNLTKEDKTRLRDAFIEEEHKNRYTSKDYDVE